MSHTQEPRYFSGIFQTEKLLPRDSEPNANALFYSQYSGFGACLQPNFNLFLYDFSM